MTNLDLAGAYLRKATVRLDVLDLLLGKDAFSDVIREAQEAVELATKGMLRAVGVEPPKIHHVGKLLVEHRARFSAPVEAEIDRISAISKQLRRERELSFYGDLDFIPTEEYTRADAEDAARSARFVVEIAGRVIPGTPPA